MGWKEDHSRNRASAKSPKGRKIRASNSNCLINTIQNYGTSKIVEKTPVNQTPVTWPDATVLVVKPGVSHRGEETPHVFYLPLTIPCEVSKPWTDKDVRPIYLFTGRDSTGADMAIWVCPFCELGIRSRRTCEKHMGIRVMFSNIKKIGCTVLRELNSKRENFVRGNFGNVMREIQRMGKYKINEDFIENDLESGDYGENDLNWF